MREYEAKIVKFIHSSLAQKDKDVLCTDEDCNYRRCGSPIKTSTAKEKVIGVNELDALFRQEVRVAQEIGYLEHGKKDAEIIINGMSMLEVVKDKKTRQDITNEVLKLIRDRLVERAHVLWYSEEGV